MPPSPDDHLRALWQKIEAFFARAITVHGAAITCHAGCDACCHRRFSVTRLEADVIRAHLRAMPAGARAAIARHASANDPARCPALDDGGRCAVYGARPLICRTHGLPLRFADDGRRHLAVVDACPKNFVGEDLASIDPSTVLDQRTLSTILGALDAAHADALGVARGERVEVAALLTG